MSERFEHQGGGEVHRPDEPLLHLHAMAAWSPGQSSWDATTAPLCCQQNLDEEKATDRKLTALAEAKINRRAA